jgi:hypothetical protein
MENSSGSDTIEIDNDDEIIAAMVLLVQVKVPITESR